MSNIKCGVIVHFMEDPVTIYGSGPYLAESLLDALKHVSHVSEALSSSVWTTNFQEWEESNGTLYYSSGPFGSRTWWQDLFNLFDIDTLLFIAFSWTGGLKVFHIDDPELISFLVLGES